MNQQNHTPVKRPELLFEDEEKWNGTSFVLSVLVRCPLNSRTNSNVIPAKLAIPPKDGSASG